LFPTNVLNQGFLINANQSFLPVLTQACAEFVVTYTLNLTAPPPLGVFARVVLFNQTDLINGIVIPQSQSITPLIGNTLQKVFTVTLQTGQAFGVQLVTSTPNQTILVTLAPPLPGSFTAIQLF